MLQAACWHGQCLVAGLFCHGGGVEDMLGVGVVVVVIFLAGEFGLCVGFCGFGSGFLPCN